MSRGWRSAAVLALVLVASTPADADWTATGEFHYVDRRYDLSGFTDEIPRPVRLADVEVVDANRNGRSAVLAQGSTDLQGRFAILVPDAAVRDVYVRVLTRSEQTPDLHIDVRTGTTGKVQHYAAAGETVVGHDPVVSIDFGAAWIGVGQGGEAFNIFDQLLLGTDYLASLLGARPGADRHLPTIWGPTNGVGGAYYNAALDQIVLRDSAGYDDTVILHEMGHYVVDQFSRSDSPAGPHGFSQCDADIRLAYDEGFATFWGNSAIRHAGIPGSHVYLRSNGAPGPGNAVLVADLESDGQYPCRGSTSEVNVFSALWDIVDGASTADATPGTDEPHDLLALPDAEVWEVVVDVLPQALEISFEDFWDGWFAAPLGNGFRTEMIDVVDRLGIELYEDPWEANDVAEQAAPVVPSAFPVHATLFADPELDGTGAPDVDLFWFTATGGLTYVVETSDLLGDANTALELRDADGLTPLAANDDRSPGDESSRIDWTAPRTDTFFLRVVHAPDLGVYGSYDLRVRVEGAVDADGDGYDSSVDCDDTDATIYPGAAETCDGVDQNCDGAVDEGFDLDLDGWTSCGGDCDDTDPAVHPQALEVCNGIDDDCNALVDDDAGGEDSDLDGVHNLCDNCPQQVNAEQTDADDDGEGDRCDLDDGVIYVIFQQSLFVEWQVETGYDAWNLYRGDLVELRASGVYTQEPGSNALAARWCDLDAASVDDGDPPLPGQAAFFLATGLSGGLESGLGVDGAGQPRPNDSPCP